MPGCALSQTKKKQIQSELQEEAITQAVQLCKEEEKKLANERTSMRAICYKVEEEWKQKRKYVRVSRDTVHWQLQGGRSSHQFNMETNSWLTKEEEDNHSAQLGCYWSSSLDSNHGCAVNANTHQEWFKLLEETIETYQIEQDCLWAADETGFQPGGGVKERVLGPAGAKIQHQQHDGNCENSVPMEKNYHQP
ncbi:hypothetical protein EDC04DRAFT_2597852 [Pisolithus marmoratus]|nr:hypothetical protein EDC04DRAFT_2597852 [Pisolithus marmoratus]